MSAQMENPVERCNADGAVKAVSTKGNHTMNDTPFEAGRKLAADWFNQNGYSLCVFRDRNRNEYFIEAQDTTPHARQAFDDGFAAGLAAFIAGVRHE